MKTGPTTSQSAIKLPDYIQLVTAAEFKQVVKRLPDDEWAIDTETDGLDIRGSDSTNKAFYVGVMPMSRKVCFVMDADDFRSEWETFKHLQYVGHNARFDFHALNVTPDKPWKDTMVQAYYRHTTGRRSLDHLARTKGWSKVATPAEIKAGNILLLDEAVVANYLGDDVLVTAKLAHENRKWGRDAEKDLNMDYAVERAVQRMESQGMRLLPDKLSGVARKVDDLIAGAKTELFKLGMNGDPSSPRQVADWLQREGVPLPRTPKGNPSTSKVALQNLADAGNSYVLALMDWRKATKMQQAFLEPLPKLARNGVLYPSVNTTRTRTGRFSYDTPNLQQIPKRGGELSKALRGCFTSPYDDGLTACDFSQVELRVAAAMANEPVLLEAFNSGRDPHAEVAAQMLGKKLEQITPQERFGAKAVNFGILNGMGAKRLAIELKSDTNHARRFLNDYRRSLHRLNDWMEGIWREAEAYRIVRTVAGRTRIFTNEEETRSAISVVVQGSAAELMRHSLVAVDQSELTPLLSIHDEIIVRGTGQGELLKDIMQTAANTAYPEVFGGVSFDAEFTEGETWGDV